MRRWGCNTLTVEDRLRTLADALPDGAAVTLPVSLIRSWLVQGGPADADHNADMTVAEVATLFNRSPQTVRTWIRHGDLDAYRLHGREYRITAMALEAFQQQQQAGAVSPLPQSATSTRAANLAAWRATRRAQP
jgi:excisionase family DNA binding protein